MIRLAGGNRAGVTTRVDLFVDPVCPFAWIAFRWLTEEVVPARDVDLRVRLMSLAVLNEGREGHTPEHEKGGDSAWRPVRVGTALRRERGEPGVREFVRAFGDRYHQERVRPRDASLRAALDDVGAAGLHRFADDPAHDDEVRAEHAAGQEPVGDDVGTPVLHVEGVAFFGPVLGAVPRGQESLDAFDGAVLLARNPMFYELKRTRSGGIDLAS